VAADIAGAASQKNFHGWGVWVVNA